MKLVSYTRDGQRGFGAVRGDEVIPLAGVLAPATAGLRQFIARGDPAAARQYVDAATAGVALADLTFLPAIPDPDKIVCIGLNYEEHRVEGGHDRTEKPTIFLRVAGSQTGHLQPVARPAGTTMLDFEGEIAVVIGRDGRHIKQADAMAHVYGYSCYNDISVRDWQRHTSQWTPGKNFDGTGAFGPWLVTADEIGTDALELTTRLNGTLMQHARSDQMNFPIPELLAYVSTFTTLRAGDVIVTGTPGGVGARRDPPVFMAPGDVVEVEVSGVGVLRNAIVGTD